MKILCIRNISYDITYSMEDYPIENFKYSMKNNKAFTLIELMAIIIILGIILVIAVPRIFNIVKESKKNTLVATSESLISKIKQKSTLNDLSNQVFTITNGAFVWKFIKYSWKIAN